MDHLIRYLSVVERIEALKPKSILEVGCGALGIGEFTNTPFTGCDIVFGRERVPSMMRVMGSASLLPFVNGSYEVVIAIDLLEHVPRLQRRTVLSELFRVTRNWLVIGVPCKPHGEYVDTALNQWYTSVLKKTPPQWLREHMANGLPMKDDVPRFLFTKGVTFQDQGNANALFILLILLGSRIPIVWRLIRFFGQRRLLRPFFSIISIGPCYRVIYSIRK